MSPKGDASRVPASVVVVAVSGGLDSCALLHMLRFPEEGGLPGAQGLRPHDRRAQALRAHVPAHQAAAPAALVAAHFDHRMRSGSEDDARWLAGLCAAWGVQLVTGAAIRPPRSEAEARSARYAFLDEVRRTMGARVIATAHHADDQAETVLFRLLRGTGPAGLQGIHAERGDGVWRPLLGIWRDELVAYAARVGLGWREDPTNVEVGFARNALRHDVLPAVEARVAPGARRALVRFAERAAHDEAGWASLLPALVESLAPERRPDGVRFDRAGLLALHPAVRARVLRALALEVGLNAGSEVTGLAVDFATSAGSGRALDVGDSVVLRRELDRLALVRQAPVRPDRPLFIPDAVGGSGSAVLAGRSVRVGWGAAAAEHGALVERFHPDALRFPLVVRAWEDGDRIRTREGDRKLKRVFLEARIPAPERRSVPVLADAGGDVLWIPGVARSAAHPGPGGPTDRDALPIAVG